MSARVPSCAHVGISAAEIVVADAGTVHIHRDIHASLPRFVNQSKGGNRLAPGRFPDRLVVSDLRRQPAFFSDGDGLSNAALHVQLFVADMGNVHSAHRAGYFCELDHLIRLAERRRHVEEARAQAERAVAHPLAHERAHALELVHAWCAVTLPNTASRTEPCPINYPMFGVIPVFAMRSSAGRSGIGEKPSGPVMSVVTPCRT